MDWGSLVAAAGGGAVVAGGAALLFKGVFDRTLDSHLKQSEERFKAVLNESLRQQGKIFDQQIEPYRSLAATIYRARNSARAFFNRHEPGAIYRSIHADEAARQLRALKTAHDHLTDILFDFRALLPSSSHSTLHDLKHVILDYLTLGHHLLEKEPDIGYDSPQEERDSLNELKVTIADRFANLDQLYEIALKDIQARLHITDA